MIKTRGIRVKMKRRPLINNKKLLLKQVMNDYTTASEAATGDVL